MTTMSVDLDSKTWDGILAQVREDDAERVDFNVTFGDLAVLPDILQNDGAPLMTFKRPEGQGFEHDNRLMSVRAYRQYLSKLGVQHRQAILFSGDLQERMIHERLAVRDADTQAPLVEPSAEIFLRCRPNSIRAILSGRYGNMRDREVAEILNERLPELSGYQVLRGRVADHLFSVTLLGKEPVFTNGDRYYPIHIVRNSEVGASSFAVESGVCKGACSNGMIFSFRKDCSHRIRHLGANMRGRVISALDEALGSESKWAEEVAPAITRAKAVEIDLKDEKQAEKAVKTLRNRGLTKKLAVEVIAFAQVLPEETYGTEFLLQEDKLVTRWHLINSMTHLAQDSERFGEIERQEIEAAAGALLLRAA